MFSNPSERFSDIRFVQSSNAPSSIVFTLPGMVADSKDTQAKKALSPMRVAVLGILISVIATQLPKALLPMLVMPSPSVIFSMFSLYSSQGDLPNS